MTEKKVIVSVGGSVERAVKGEYSIDVKAILTEAWQKTLQSRMSINVSLFFVLLFGMFVSFFSSDFFGGIEVVFEDPQSLQMVNIIVTIAVWPFIAGIEMMGVYHAINRPTQINMVFTFLNRGSWVALCALLTSLLISIGFQLLVIPGILLAVLLSLTIPLVVEKKLTPMQAIILSIKALRFKVFPILSIYGILFMSLMVIMLPIALLLETSLAPVGIMIFLFCLSFVAPWYYNVKGVLYREIFGVYVDEDNLDKDLNNTQNNTQNNHENNSTDHNGSDDTFSA